MRVTIDGNPLLFSLTVHVQNNRFQVRYTPPPTLPRPVFWGKLMLLQMKYGVIVSLQVFASIFLVKFFIVVFFVAAD